jgi:hypothetical protein
MSTKKPSTSEVIELSRLSAHHRQVVYVRASLLRGITSPHEQKSANGRRA